MSGQFIHLRVHSEFSVSDSIVRIKPMMQALAERKSPAVALTDLNNLFAAVKFYKAAMQLGVKPLLGCDIRVKNPEDPKQPFELVLLCQNQTGYHNLTCIVSKAYTNGQDTGVPLVDKQWLREYSAGLIALSGGIHGELGQSILTEQPDLTQANLDFYTDIFADRFYIELQRTGRKNEETYNIEACKLAAEKNIPVVATNDVRFIKTEDFEAHEARVCINSGYTLIDPKRPKLYSEQQHLRTSEEMQQLFSDIPSAIENTFEIAKRCNLSFDFGTYYLPDFPVPQGMTIDEFFAAESKKGLEERLEILYDSSSPDFADIRKPYDERLQEELSVICQMGFPGYFLIVADFIQWGKSNGVPVGPGRGSGAGSLIAYALKITDLDPLEYDLLFERFLNPERVSMPDFDVDFCMDGRDRVIDYVAKKYGRNSVSQIITYGTMAAKAVIRDVGRVFGHPYGFVDQIAKLIPFEIGMTLDKALGQEEVLRDRYNKEDEVKELIDLARKLEGITRNAGKHAGGVVIAPSDLTDFAPLYCEPGSSQHVTQFDKDDVETIGLVKFDFLGLRTLTIINWAVISINAEKQQKGEELLNIDLIPVDDAATFELLKACNTTAVFQLESRGMKDLIKRLQPDCFEDIVALVALFRPGPLQSGMVDDFIDRKHGRAEVEYPHPDLEPILKPTYGVILYQEQVMQIAQVLAGYTLGGADLLRRAMGKKKPEEMAKQRVIFTEGAVKRGVDKDQATYIFDLMEKFAGYGFNKSHSAAYALVSYQTAWLKAHYPSQFMAAVLSSDMDNTEKVVNFIEDCADMGIKILDPSINQGNYKFVANPQGEIIYGLGAVKGVGEAVIQDIVNEREAGGAFKDLNALCIRVGAKKLNRRVLEAFIRSGSFDCLHANRATMFASFPSCLQLATQTAKEQASGQMSLFAEFDTPEQTVEYTEVEPWDEKVRLQGEKETLGHYRSGHPIDRYADELKQFITAPIAKLKPNENRAVVVAGFIASVRTILTKKNDKMAFVSLQDQTGSVDLAVFSDVLTESRDLVVKDQLVIVEGEVSLDDYSGGIRMSCSKLLSIEEARSAFGKQIVIKLDQLNQDNNANQKLASTIEPFKPGKFPIQIEYQRPEGKARIALGKAWNVTPKDELIENLHKHFGRENVVVEYWISES